MVVLDEWYEVTRKMAVRELSSLMSDKIESIARGMRVHVIERDDYEPNRVKIDYPLEGWCSLKSQNGRRILAPVQDESDEEIPNNEKPELDDADLKDIMGSLPDLAELQASIKGLKRQRQDVQKDLPPAKKPRLDSKPPDNSEKEFEKDGLRTGMLVEIHGLQSAAGQALNGKTGIIESYDHAKGRWRVLVKDRDKVVSLKPQNLNKQESAEENVQNLLDSIDVTTDIPEKENANKEEESKDVPGNETTEEKSEPVDPIEKSEPMDSNESVDPKEKAESPEKQDMQIEDEEPEPPKPPRQAKKFFGALDKWCPLQKEQTVYFLNEEGQNTKGFIKGMFEWRQFVVEVAGPAPRDEIPLDFDKVCQSLPATTHSLSKASFNDQTVMTIGYNETHTRIMCEFPDDMGVKAIKLENLMLKRNVIVRVDHTSVKKLNGQFAVVLGWDKHKKRYHVRILETGKECSLRPKNVFI